MTGDPGLATAVQDAVKFIARARGGRDHGWRYDPGQFGDTSVLGWQVMALKSAQMSGITVPSDALETAGRWLEQVEHRSRPGLYAYQPGGRATHSMTAEGMFTQQLLGLRRSHPRIQASAEYIAKRLPKWHSDASTYYWYYATLALFHHQGDHWQQWNEALTDELLTHQRTDGRTAGSWDPEDKWSMLGGRVYQTALCTLMLEVYYRYLPLYNFDNEDPDGAIGTIRGRVTDAATGEPLSGAAVRLDLPDRASVTVASNDEGRYVLYAPQVPAFFALSALHDGYVPKTVNIESARLADRIINQDFALQPERVDIVAIEDTPRVHHLGNDAFEGAINSQFQKKSEGREFSAAFDLTDKQVTPFFNVAHVWMLTKGVQCPHEIYINGRLLDARMVESPSDGSFGVFTEQFDVSLLQEGSNRITIRTQRCRGDLDDFEFVNVQIHLAP